MFRLNPWLSLSSKKLGDALEMRFSLGAPLRSDTRRSHAG